ncbi:MAG: PhzF family phenazine biosynthesis protein [Anaerolineales bacterium]|nr:PhzF family phenazine biosynthesis protein [Anaerolineales bacterium]
MDIKLYQVDAFTDQPFHGNPAAVCMLPEVLEAHDVAWMQSIASEMNLSETAFLQRVEDGFNLRWFTPTVEVDLCGHATLASSHILYEQELLSSNQEARFHTKSGLLTAKKRGEEIELNFPATPPDPVKDDPGLAGALGVNPVDLGQSKFDYLVRVATEAEVREARPDFAELNKLGVRGVMLTSHSESGEYDFISRFFAPGAGVDEDPVTGSAHCCLGPYWGEILGKEKMVAYQASARGGVIQVRVGEERVYLGGQAVTVMSGELLV